MECLGFIALYKVTRGRRHNQRGLRVQIAIEIRSHY